MGQTQVMWFRRDLRVADNPALAAAQAGGGRLIAVFVLDLALLRGPRVGAPRLAYLADALADLDGRLAERGSRLVVRHGRPAEIIPEVAAAAEATAVHVNDDVSPFARRRDAEVARRLAEDGRRLEAHDGLFVHPPGSITTGAGDPYKVFTPFHRSWRRDGLPAPLPSPAALPPTPGLTGDGIPGRGGLGAADAPAEPVGGESHALSRLEAFLEQRASAYHERRDLLGVEGTSRLSADLHYGCLSPRTILARLDDDDPGHEAFATEIAWRDFYGHVLHAWPEVVDTEFNPVWRALPWEGEGPRFDAWREGRTGFPVVDAAMRQLLATGWMHNRARMIVASFLCKDLRIDWRLGEAHFLRHLVDGDVASNNGGWQWAAGTGTDAQPYFRIFNPTTQGQRFDPDGAYVRRWVPELAAVPDRSLHEPAAMPAATAREVGLRLGEDYPWPIVDHAEERKRTLAWFKEHRLEG